MEQVKKLVEAGSSIPSAIKESLALLGLSMAAFADKHQRPRPWVSNVINGNVRATAADIAALHAELGGTEKEWRELLYQAAKPVAV